MTVSGAFRDRNGTNAAEIDPRFGRVTSVFGDPATTDANLVVNAELPLANDTVLYGFVTGAHRDSEMTPLFRAPNVARAFTRTGSCLWSLWNCWILARTPARAARSATGIGM